MTVYVSRAADGTVNGVYRWPNPQAQEARDDQGADVLAFLAPLTRRPRTLFAIRADLAALTAAQKANVWAALTAGSPPLWATDAGRNAAALAALQMLGASATLPAADVLEAKLRAAAMYLQDNVRWLTRPAFDPSIDVDGSMPGP